MVSVAHEGQPKSRRFTKMATKKTQLKSAKKTNKIMTLTASKHPV
jgi:hypothetical protein